MLECVGRLVIDEVHIMGVVWHILGFVAPKHSRVLGKLQGKKKISADKAWINAAEFSENWLRQYLPAL